MTCDPCTCSPEPAADSSLTSSLDTSRFAPSSGTSTAATGYATGSPQGGSLTCTCITEMSDCSIHPRGKDEWIASMRASLAKTSALPVTVTGSMASEAAYTAKSSASLTWFDRASSSWKTHQQSLVEDWVPFSETWPRAGTMLDGQCWPLPMWERITSVNGGGALRGEVKVMDGSTYVPPTPTKREFYTSDANLIARKRKMGRVSVTLACWLGGPPNPPWVEWYMGWPIGWTAPLQSETAKSRSAPQPRGASLEDRK